MFFTAQPKIIMKCNLHTSNQTVLDFTLQVLLVMPRVKDYRQLNLKNITVYFLSGIYKNEAELHHRAWSVCSLSLCTSYSCSQTPTTLSRRFPQIQSCMWECKRLSHLLWTFSCHVWECSRKRCGKLTANVEDKEVTYTNLNLDWVLSASDSLQSVHIFKTVFSVDDMSFKLIIHHHKTPTHDTLLL